jgi:hypothetical protein
MLVDGLKIGAGDRARTVIPVSAISVVAGARNHRNRLASPSGSRSFDRGRTLPDLVPETALQLQQFGIPWEPELRIWWESGIGPDFPEARTRSQVAARALEGVSRLSFVVGSCSPVDRVAYTLTGIGVLGVFRPIRGGSVSATRSGQSDGVRRTQPPTLTSARPTKLSVVRWPDPWSPAGHPRTACKRQGLACWREARRAHDRWPCQPCATPLPPGASEKAPPRPRTSRGP